jgi:DNA-binding IclR family transcriptional regulator
VVESSFALLELVAALQPARLVDLTDASGMPHPTVHRLLQQLMTVGAIRRDGSRYSLGSSLLRLGTAVTPVARLRMVARRPMAELAAATGAAVSLSANLGEDVVYLDALEARVPVGYIAAPGARVPPETAQGRAHVELGATAPIVDAGQIDADLSCVAVAVPLGNGEVAAVSTLIPAPRPPLGLLAATRATAARIADLLRAPAASQG